MRKTVCHVTGRIKEIKDCELQFDIYDLAWCAGFFDGEGYVGFFFSDERKYPTINISIKQLYPESLLRFNEIVKVGKVIGPYNTGTNSHKPLYRYQVNTFEQVQFVMCLLWPYLCSIKKHQFNEAIRNYLKEKNGFIYFRVPNK